MSHAANATQHPAACPAQSRSHRVARWLAAATAATLALTACGSTSKPAKSDPTTPQVDKSSSAASAAAPVAATAADPKPELLTIVDLPTGWAVDNSSSSTATTPECLKKLKTSYRAPRHGEASFIQGSLPSLDEQIGTYSTAADAAAGFARGTAILDGCTTITVDSDGQSFKGSIGAMSFPHIGTQSKAWAITLTSSGITAGVDVVVFQKNAEIAAVLLSDVGHPSVEDLTMFAQKALTKLS